MFGHLSSNHLLEGIQNAILYLALLWVGEREYSEYSEYEFGENQFVLFSCSTFIYVCCLAIESFKQIILFFKNFLKDNMS